MPNCFHIALGHGVVVTAFGLYQVRISQLTIVGPQASLSLARCSAGVLFDENERLLKIALKVL